MKVYSYPKCSSCKKALKELDAKGIGYKLIDISEKAPSKAELKKMLKSYDGDLKKLFNTSGKIYRERKIKEKLANMTEAQAIDMLHAEGMLVKRPFVLSDQINFVGYKEECLAKCA